MGGGGGGVVAGLSGLLLGEPESEPVGSKGS